MANFAEIIIKDVNGNRVVISDSGQMHVVLMGKVDTDNTMSDNPSNWRHCLYFSEENVFILLELTI